MYLFICISIYAPVNPLTDFPVYLLYVFFVQFLTWPDLKKKNKYKQNKTKKTAILGAETVCQYLFRY